jgi:hypothetical protein
VVERRGDVAHVVARFGLSSGPGTVTGVTIEADAWPLPGRFAERACAAMLAAGWEVGGDGPADGRSIFLGDFQQPITAEFLASVQFILEGGPTVCGVELELVARVAEGRRFRASVGGEIGVRHLPTERLLQTLQMRCEADVSLEIADIFEADRRTLPTMTDEASVDGAARVLVAAVMAHALPFARAHASVDAMVEFVTRGRQINRGQTFEYIFVPTVFAASGRATEARAALSAYRDRVKPGTEEDAEYTGFSDRLTRWLG